MDKFSELISKGVASFHYTPIAHDVPINCGVCRFYNNLYANTNNTHMSVLDNGQYVITGHFVANQDAFEKWLDNDTYANVDFRKYGTPRSFLKSVGLRGYYDVLNGDYVYILDKEEQTDNEYES